MYAWQTLKHSVQAVQSCEIKLSMSRRWVLLPNTALASGALDVTPGLLKAM